MTIPLCLPPPDDMYDPVTGFETALARVASYLWQPGPGYSEKERAAMIFPRPAVKVPAPTPVPAPKECHGTRYIPEEDE